MSALLDDEERLKGLLKAAIIEALEEEAAGEEKGRPDFERTAPSAAPSKGGLRKLFWSVARMFHPDHADDEEEARRRHAIMAEASRAYRDGDVKTLSTLLGNLMREAPREAVEDYALARAIEDAARSSEQVDLAFLAEQGLAGGYGPDEPEYSLDLIKEPNPEYERR